MWKAWCQRLPPCEMSGPDAGNGDVEHGERPDPLGDRARQRERGRPAPVVTDEVKTVELEALAHFAQVGGDAFLVVSAVRARAIAQPGQVGNDQPVGLREQRNDLAPFMPGLRPAMQQHYRLAGARADDVQHDPRKAQRTMLHLGAPRTAYQVEHRAQDAFRHEDDEQHQHAAP